jgi:hypothetical protein
MKKKLVAIFISSLFLSVQAIKAADFNVDCTEARCVKDGLEPIFSEAADGWWYPGKTVARTINLKNSANGLKMLALNGIRSGEISLLEEVLQLRIIGERGVIWTGRVSDFYVLEKVEMGSLAAGEDQDYRLMVSMSKEAGNNYRNKKTTFEMNLGFWQTGQLGEAGSTMKTEGKVAGAEQRPLNFWSLGLILVLVIYVMIKTCRRLRR